MILDIVMNDVILDNVLGFVGNILMVYLNRVFFNCCVKIVCKLEVFGFCRSVKDWIVLVMVEDVERWGLIKFGVSILIELMSGNMGIGFVFVCVFKGYKFIFMMLED